MNKGLFLLSFWLLAACKLFGQSIEHPHIWVDASERQQILNNIEQFDWAKSQFEQYVQRQTSLKQSHKSNPTTFLSNLDGIPGERTNHREDLNAAAEQAVLYYLTDDEDYAQLAADVLHHYFKLISAQNPNTIKFFDPESSNSHHIQIRELYTRIGITYDLIHSFVSKTGATVYDVENGSRVAFDFEVAQKALEVLAENVLLVGGKNSNHPLLELAGGMYVTLCMDDDAKRKSYYDRFWQDEPGQNSISWMIENVPEEGNIWPEAMGYSKEVHDILLRNLIVIDRYDPDRNVLMNNQRLLDGAFVFDDFKYPNNRIMAFGDTHRHQSETDHIIRYVHYIANQKGLTEYEDKAGTILKAHYETIGGYKPTITTERLNWDTPTELFWGVDVPETTNAAATNYSSTGVIKHAGVVMQRNDVAMDNQEYGLMYYTGGATYVHAHATGIDLEIYGAGYVIGPEFGRETYGSDIHEQYAVSPAAHNTVIVNGSSGRGAKTIGNSTWQNIVGDITLEAVEPKAAASRIAENFSFSSQYLDDPFSDVSQLRTNSIIRTSPTSGYYVDIFRSKSNVKDDFHDYLFHGIGDDLQVFSNDLELALTNTPDRFQNDIGDERKQPGWRWFSEAKTSKETAEAVRARFDLSKSGKFLHVHVPGNVQREYTTALAPPSRYVRDYASTDTKMFIMRKQGEAWGQPFIVIYEPSSDEESRVHSTTPLYGSGKIVGVQVISSIGDHQIIDYVIAQEQDGGLFNAYDIAFEGRFGIVRAEVMGNETKVSMYIGKGEKLTFQNQELVADSEGKAFSEFTLDFAYEAPELVLSDQMISDHISVYPNPSPDGIFTLSQHVGYSIYDISGVLIHSNEGKVIDLSNSPKGVYILKVGSTKIKLVK
ncbi:MAG: T9SS type A sorting domain-containing protein [Cyclobacteriaceae bacterium]